MKQFGGWKTPEDSHFAHHHGGLVQMIFLYKWVIFRFQPLIFWCIVPVMWGGFMMNHAGAIFRLFSGSNPTGFYESIPQKNVEKKGIGFWIVFPFWTVAHMNVSENRGTPNHPFFWMFHYKPSILGVFYPYFWKHPSCFNWVLLGQPKPPKLGSWVLVRIRSDGPIPREPQMDFSLLLRSSGCFGLASLVLDLSALQGWIVGEVFGSLPKILQGAPKKRWVWMCFGGIFV